MTTPTKDVATTTTDSKRGALRLFLEQQKPELQKLLPKNMSMDRFVRIALTECVKNPDLLRCSPESWALAMQKCAATGLYPDSDLGFMWLIPRENSKNRGGSWVKVWEVTAQRGYQGDIQLARNSGEVASIYAEVVYEKDTYVVRKGLNPTLEHVPYEPKSDDDSPGALRAAYAVAKLDGGEIVWVNLWKFDVMRHKASSMSTGEKSPWTKHEASMWKKSAIKELVKWLPKATEAMQELAKDEESRRERESQMIDITPKVEGPKIDLPKAGVEGLKARLSKEQQTASADTQEETQESDEQEPATEGQKFDAEVEKAASLFTEGEAAPETCLCETPEGAPGSTCAACTLPILAAKKADAPKGGRPKMERK